MLQNKTSEIIISLLCIYLFSSCDNFIAKLTKEEEMIARFATNKNCVEKSKQANG